MEGLPGRLVQVESARVQILTLPIVRGITEHILKPPLAVAEIRERQPHVTLAWVGGIVHCYQQPVSIRALPRQKPGSNPTSSCPPRRAHVRAIAIDRRARLAGAVRSAAGRRTVLALWSMGSSGPRTKCGEMRFVRPWNGPWWKKRSPGGRNVMTAAASWTSGAKVAAARGSSWFSRKRASLFCKSSPAWKCSRTGRACPSRRRSYSRLS